MHDKLCGNISKSINRYQKKGLLRKKRKPMTQKGMFDIDRSEASQTVISSFIISLNNGFLIYLHIKQLLEAKISKSLFKIEEKRDAK